MKLSEIIKRYRIEHNLSTRSMADRVGCTNAYISLLENDKVKSPTIELLNNLAKAMNVDLHALLDLMDDMDIALKSNNSQSLHNIPLYENISCGKGLFINEQPEDYIAVPDRFINPNAEYFANIASGDSMTGKDIKEGDVLVFEKTNVLENGQIGSFCVDDENYCKVFRKLPDGTILLESANDQYDPIIVNIQEQCFRIIGKYKFKFSVEQ